MMGRNRGERVKKRKNIMLQIFPPADKVPRTKNGAEVQMMMMGSTSNTSNRKSFSTGSRWSFHTA
jgi:hypothetical protein